MPLIHCIACRQVCPANRSGRCERCRLAKQRQTDRAPARAAVKAERYDADYRAERRLWEPIVAVDGYRCARGGEHHPPGAPFDLDHINGTLAPSCPPHNRARTPTACSTG